MAWRNPPLLVARPVSGAAIRQARLSTTGHDEDDEEVLLGEAVVLVDPLPADEAAPAEASVEG